VWQGSGEEGKEEEGANLVMYLCFPFFSHFFLFCAGGSKDGRRRRRRRRREEGCNRYRFFFVSSAIGVVVLLDHLHYRDGT